MPENKPLPEAWDTARIREAFIYDFDRWLATYTREVEAAYAEKLADEYGPAQISGFLTNPSGYVKAWLRTRAAERRKDQA